MHPFAIAGFLTAMATAHAVIAVYCLFAPRRSSRREPSPRLTLRSDASEILLFGALNLAIAFEAGALAWSIGATNVGAALVVARAARGLTAILLVLYALAHTRLERPWWLIATFLGVAGFFEAANGMGLLVKHAEITGAYAFGVPIPNVRVRPTVLGVAAMIAWLGAALGVTAMFVQSMSKRRRDMAALIGATVLSFTAILDALALAGLVDTPLLSQYGCSALVNGVMMSLLSRFGALRVELEAQALTLKQRSRELTRANDELRAAQDELVRKEQLAAVGELSAVIAHEVRNPLAIISNAIASLRRPGIVDEDRATLLKILDEESSRLNRLVSDLLRYVRPIAPQKQPIVVRELVERCLAIAEGQPDILVELHEPEPVEKIHGDHNLLRQVIENLITNAMQAMQDGGTLTLTLVKAERDGMAGVELSIQDTGEGMDTLVRTRALDPFFTTRPAGTGLGLAIVARIVDAHGGNLTIRSKAGAGTAVIVFLPIDAPPKSARASKQDSVPPVPTEVLRAMKP